MKQLTFEFYHWCMGPGRFVRLTAKRPVFRDYEPEQAYGTHHDLREHRRYGGTREDY